MRSSRGARWMAAAAVMVAVVAGAPTPAVAGPWAAKPGRSAGTLPSGLTVSLKTASMGGVVRKGTTTMPAGAYADDGVSGAPAHGIVVTHDMPADDVFRRTGSVTITVSRPVRDPRVHVGNLGGASPGAS